MLAHPGAHKVCDEVSILACRKLLVLQATTHKLSPSSKVVPWSSADGSSLH